MMMMCFTTVFDKLKKGVNGQLVEGSSVLLLAPARAQSAEA